jgi:hypothetical protein
MSQVYLVTFGVSGKGGTITFFDQTDRETNTVSAGDGNASLACQLGDSLIVTATPYAGYDFDHFEVTPATSPEPMSTTMNPFTTDFNSPFTIIAYFKAGVPYVLVTFGVSSQGGGSVTILDHSNGETNTVGPSPNSQASLACILGDNISISAAAESGYEFSSFIVTGPTPNDSGQTGTNPFIVTLAYAFTIVAYFAPISTPPGTVTTIIGAGEGGTVNYDDSTSGLSGTVAANSEETLTGTLDDSITVTAVPASGNKFVEWTITGPLTGSGISTGTNTSNPFTWSLTPNFTVIASFEPITTSPGTGLTTAEKVAIAGGVAGAALIVIGVAASSRKAKR